LFLEHLLAGGLQWLLLQAAVNPGKENVRDCFLTTNLCLEHTQKGIKDSMLRLIANTVF